MLLCTISCNEEPQVSANEQQLLYGDWVLDNAVREGRLTQLLNGTTMSYDSNTVKTNLLGEDTTYDYIRQGMKLNLSDAKKQVLKIDKSTADTLIVQMKRNGKSYQLLMVRPKE